MELGEMASKALLVGVNEYKKYPPLRGCIHDVADVEAVLLDQLAFDPRNVSLFLLRGVRVVCGG